MRENQQLRDPKGTDPSPVGFVVRPSVSGFGGTSRLVKFPLIVIPMREVPEDAQELQK